MDDEITVLQLELDVLKRLRNSTRSHVAETSEAWRIHFAELDRLIAEHERLLQMERLHSKQP